MVLVLVLFRGFRIVDPGYSVPVSLQQASTLYEYRIMSASLDSGLPLEVQISLRLSPCSNTQTMFDILAANVF
jgi:hypothetical protein